MMKNRVPPIKFVNIALSPWSEKARWAMDYTETHYQSIPFTPMITNLKARYLSKNFTSELTIPIAVDGQQILNDSFEIAKNTNNKTQNKNLFPAGYREELSSWNELSEQLLKITRIRVIPRMKANKHLMLALLPSFIPDWLKPFMGAIAKKSLDDLAKKYPVDDQASEKQLKDGLNRLRTALKESGGGYILGGFSYADICMSVVFQFIFPVENELFPIDDLVRETWVDESIKEEFSDLIAWRDFIYRQHRHS